jgi:hypothetical protein
MINPRALAAAVVAVGAGGVLFLSTGQQSASPEPAGGGPVPVAIPPAATVVPEVPTTHPAAPAAERVSPPSTAVPAPSTQPTPKRPSTATTPTRKAAPKPKRTATPSQVPPSYSEMDLGNGWTAYCSNGYLQPDGSCSSRPEGYHPAPAPADDPCSGTGTECLNATLGQLGIYNGIPGLMGGR